MKEISTFKTEIFIIKFLVEKKFQLLKNTFLLLNF